MQNTLTKTLLLPTLLVGAIGVTSCRTTHETTTSNRNTTTTTAPSRASSAGSTSTTGSDEGAQVVNSSARRKGNMLSARLAYPTGDIDTSALMVEKLTPVEVVAGQPFDYEMVVTNLTSLPLENVVVTETKDANFAVNMSEPKAVASASTYSWDLGTIGPKQTRSIRVNGKATGSESLKSCASVTYSSSLCSTIPVVEPALKLVCSGPAEVLQCDEIVYNYVVTNTGTGTARDIVLDVNLPEGLVDANGRSSVSRKIGALDGGESQEFSLSARANRTGEFSHTAMAKAAGDLTAEGTACATNVSKPQLKIEKTGPKKSFAGRDLKYQITVSNIGNGVARDAVLEDSLPTNTSFKSASDGGRAAAGKVRWNLGNLAPNATKTFDVRVTADTIGRVVNRAMASAYCADPVTAMVETDVTGIPAVLLEVIDLEDPIQVGENETYEITVTNQGSVQDTNISIVCTLESQHEFVSASGATNGSHSGGVVTFEPLPSLAAKAKATWRVTVKAAGAGDVRFAVQMNTDELQRPVDETEATNFYE